MKQTVRKASRPFLTDLDEDKNGKERSYSVDYHHPKGLATLSAHHNLKTRVARSYFSFNHEGQMHSYSFDKYYTPKGLARKAFKILNEL